jgi:hypothetical protein
MASKIKAETRRRMVCMIRDWLKSDPRMSPEAMQQKLLANGMDLSLAAVLTHLNRARILLNRERLFGAADAERLFPESRTSRNQAPSPWVW